MIELYGKPHCGYCVQAAQLLEESGLEFKKYIIDEDISREEFVSKFPDVRTVPLVYVDGERLGGFQSLKEYIEKR